MIDLHTHSNISDGTFSPRELIQQAKKIGLTAIALTDHDSIDGLEEAQNEADKLGVCLLKGIEFSVAFGNKSLIHVLGLNIDTSNEDFLKIYNHYRQLRASKLSHVFETLHQIGINITPDDVEPYISGGFMDRQAIAKCMVGKSYTESVRDSWVNYLDKAPYTDGELINAADAFSAIHAAGGKAFLAHFHLPIGLKGYSDEEARHHLLTLQKLGLDGIEFYYPSFTEEDSLRCAKYINDYGFLKSGGTDFHGGNRPHIKLGIGEGQFNVPDELLHNITDKVIVSD